ncbi:MocR-like pyridoxine biosynthesis transcription factor PdxR [Kitasatospora sp. NBC_01302]|uniref:MocR-like pyridoxine biosynthesis transcription factor PdxR n=1 Tax=Kitasatospora sp. NBC_01302 TaxID=2903575 RepID=UPI002E15AE28|nr:PLP-dependent aminotransferase family protein [Kitasatospora sp. NBC_01302]
MSWQLALTLDRDCGRPLAAQVRDGIRQAISDGTLRPGTRLPSSRSLCADLGVSRSVLVEAYAQLTAEGYLTTRQGSGSRVAAPPRQLRAETRSALTAPGPPPAADPALCDLRTGTGAVRSFPHRDWLRCAAAVIRQADASGLGYGPTAGHPLLRQVLAGHLGRVRGVRVAATDVMVTSGFAQGLALLCQVLKARGLDRVAVEDPSHPGQRDFIRSSGLAVLGIPVDGEGLRVDALARSGARAVLVTPGNQFPTAVPLSDRRRAELVDWAARAGGLVIEDDFDGAFQPAGRRRPALQSLDPDRVVHAGTTSKTLAPALRLGWLAGPPQLMGELEGVRVGWDLGCSGLEQLTLARFLDTGGLDRHLRRLGTELAERRALVREAFAGLGGLTGAGAGEGGLQAYLRLPAGVDEQALVREAARRRVLVRGGRHYALGAQEAALRVDPAPAAPALVVSYATPGRSALADGLAVLAELLRG